MQISANLTIDDVIERADELDRRRQLQLGRQQEIIDRLLESNRNLLAQQREEARVRRINSAQSRKLMDHIRDDPGFPPLDSGLLFGDRAIRVVDRLRSEISRLEAENAGLRKSWLDGGERDY